MNAKNPANMIKDMTPKAGSVERANQTRAKLLKLHAEGLSNVDAAKIAGIHVNTITHHLKNNREFAEKWNQISLENQAAASSGATYKSKVPTGTFEEFVRKYAKITPFWHHQQMMDVVEGDEPRDLHFSETFVRGRKNRILINCPPFAAKSTILTTWYIVYKICQDPSLRCAIISKSQETAIKRLLLIKDIMTSDMYPDLIRDFAPAQGWKSSDMPWTADKMYISNRDKDQNDPTVQALGVKSAIYGSRLDLVILDDVEDSASANLCEEHFDWLQDMVGTRLPPRSGKIIIVMTRMAAKDLSSVVLDPDHFLGDSSPYTYLRIPAILDTHDSDDPEDWESYWPWSNIPLDKDAEIEPNEEGLYPAWPGPMLAERKNSLRSIEAWERLFQQNQIDSDQHFRTEDVMKSVQRRSMGPLPESFRPGGMTGLTIVGGVDPASGGNAGVSVYAADLKTGHRWLLDAASIKMARTFKVRQQIKDYTIKYPGVWWQIEANSNQTYLSEEPELNTFVASHGGRISSVYTGSNKHDAEVGVLAMASLFNGAAEGNNLIHLPSIQNEAIGTLVGELIAWQPGRSGTTKVKSDMVMSLWFCERRILSLIRGKQTETTPIRRNPYTSRGELSNRKIYNFSQITED